MQLSHSRPITDGADLRDLLIAHRGWFGPQVGLVADAGSALGVATELTSDDHPCSNFPTGEAWTS